MKKEFYGFYAPNQTEIDKSWNEGIFVFDANTLLNLYRYSDSTRKDFLMVLSKLKEKLHMPYQVGYEYHSNRNSVIENLDTSYYTLSASIKDICDKAITSAINQYVRHPSIEVEILKKTLNEFVKKLDTELEKQKKKHPDFKKEDEVLKQLTELYENKVGVPFSEDDLKKIYIEGKQRYDKLIPPGYKDLETKKKKGEQHIYGDLIIWKELISLTTKEKKEIIFITDDRKEDWWTIENGKTIRPREELIKEFYDLTGIRILIYNADNFLHFAKERKLATSIKEQSITEVKEVRQADEISITLNELNDRNLELSKIITNSVPSKWYSINSRMANLMQDAEIVDRLNFTNPNMDALNKLASTTSNLETLRNISERWNYDTPNLEAIRKLTSTTPNLDTLKNISERWNYDTPNLEAIRKLTSTTPNLDTLRNITERWNYDTPSLEIKQNAKTPKELTKLDLKKRESVKSSDSSISKNESSIEKTPKAKTKGESIINTTKSSQNNEDGSTNNKISKNNKKDK